MSAPLSLPTEQLAVLMAGAERVPSNWRRRYLDDVADRLLGRLMTCDAELDDATVQTCVQTTLSRIGLNEGENNEVPNRRRR